MAIHALTSSVSSRHAAGSSSYYEHTQHSPGALSKTILSGKERMDSLQFKKKNDNESRNLNKRNNEGKFLCELNLVWPLKMSLLFFLS